MASTTVKSRDDVDQSTLAEIAHACGISIDQIEDVYGCTSMQLGYVIERPDLWLNFVVSFGPDADVDKFCAALEKAVALNAIFRTQIVQTSIGYVQVVTKVDHKTERQSGGLEEYLKETHTWSPEGPLFRTIFIDRTFIATVHHSIMDHYSWTLFLDVDVASIYQGLELKPRPPFRDFITQYQSVDEAAAKTFWTSRFQGIPTVFPTPQQNEEICALEMEPRTVHLPQIGNAVPHFQVPLYIEAALALTLYSYADSDRIVYNYLMSGRSGEFEQTLGPTLVEVPIQVNFQRNMTVSQLIKDRSASLRQLQREPTLQCPKKKIGTFSEAAAAAVSATTLLNVVPKAPKENTEEGSGVKLERIVRPRRECIPLYLLCQPLEDGVRYEPRHDPAHVSEEQMERLLRQFEHLLDVLTNAPQDAKLTDLNLFSPSDRSELLQWNKAETKSEVPGETLPEIVTAHAQSQPDAKAVDTGDESITHKELDQFSDRISHELNRKGISTGDKVALVSERSLWAVVSILAILKAGAACVPVNPKNGQKEATISGAGAKALLTSPGAYESSAKLAPIVIAVSRDTISTLPEGPKPDNAKGPSAEDVAYVSFTDGITGASKSVLLDHRSLLSSISSVVQRLGLQTDSKSRVLQLAEYTSIASISEIFGALLSGGTVSVSPEISNAANLATFIESNAVTSAFLTPTTLRSMAPDSVPSLQTVVSFGEPLDVNTSVAWAKATRLFNGFSASETAGFCTLAEVNLDSPVPRNIGTPVGHSAWIVNSQDPQQLASIGAVGELVIGGPNLAKGHLKEDMKTKAAFISSPRWAPQPDEDGASTVVKGDRYYRTGELVKYNSNGSISYIGRLANRVKFGVHFIQFEEIENAILSSAEVRDAVTLTKINKGRTQIFAVISLSDAKFPHDTVLQQLSAETTNTQLKSIRDNASSKLPPHKVPLVWLLVERLPQTASGKFDRAAVKDWLKTLK